MINVDSVRETCEACPSQWEGFTNDGRMIYVRYRWGGLRVTISPKQTEDIMDAVGGDEIYFAQHGGEWDGDMSYGELIAHTKHLISWPTGEDA